MRFFCLLFISLLSAAAFAQNSMSVVPADFRLLPGCWSGSLTYLDYGTNKNTSIPVICKVDPINSGFICLAISFPAEPHANSKDTISISEDGYMLNDEKVLSKLYPSPDSVVIITMRDGVDGHENRKAQIRHQYSFSTSYWQLRKEIMFEGEKEWIVRNTFSFKKLNDCE